MGRMKILDASERRAERRRLHEQVDTMSIAEAVRTMRRISGLTQAEFAERVAGISLTALAQIERGEANPTVSTLSKIGAAFGLEIGYRRSPRT